MKIRELELKDAPYMLEWMHDEKIVENLRGNFSEKTRQDCERFIEDAKNKEKDIHLAVVNSEDEYMGTVSLKNIAKDSDSAEFAIAIRKVALGQGYSWYGMKEVLRRGFEIYGLKNIYWCVSKENTRAIRFYNKHNFKESEHIAEDVLERYRGIDNLKWYSVFYDEFEMLDI